MIVINDANDPRRFVIVAEPGEVCHDRNFVSWNITERIVADPIGNIVHIIRYHEMADAVAFKLRFC